ncbi:GRIP and coiled-coil domain-containing protein 2 [Copidosoma floridanum]|uniref:GRIP and coiled-coil domain-containing protein 2 n=1 Tax=Copidosoma floridanum TaxID=29053 RepID=UPI000C6FB54B|nr:GRIP and coiled-coil domain-containing protein 2 [Copidosoma floridanum]
MVDPNGVVGKNVSLPSRLQPPEIGEDWTSEDAADQPTIINTQMATYDIFIDDLRNKIIRAQAKNEELEKLCELAKGYLGDFAGEVESAIVELNNNIASEVKRINDNKKKCEEIENSSEELRSKHLLAVKLSEEKYEKTRTRFYAEIKALNARVNAIEDFKSKADNLKARYDRQNESILRKEEEMQQKLKQIQLKSIEHQENLRKEAYKGILDVSQNFQLELKNTAPQTTQRLMRENVILDNQLDQFFDDFSRMKQDSSEQGTQMDSWVGKIKEAQKNKQNYIQSIKIQNVALKKLKRTVIRMETLEPFQQPEGFEQKSLKLLETMNLEFSRKDYYRRVLEVIAHRESIKCTLTNELKTKTSSALTKCCDVLNLLKRVVSSALNIRTSISLNFKNWDLRTLAYYLLDVIDDYDSQKSTFSLDLLESDSTSIQSMHAESDEENKYVEIKDLDQEADNFDAMAHRTSIIVKDQHDSSASSNTSTDESVGSNKEIIKKKSITFSETGIIMEDEESEETYFNYGFHDVYEDFLNHERE